MMNAHPGPWTRRLRRRTRYRAPEREAEAAAWAWTEAELQVAVYRAGILVVLLAAATLPLAALLP